MEFSVDNMDCEESDVQSKVNFEMTNKEVDAPIDRSSSSSSYSSDLSQESATNNISHSNPALQSKPDHVPESPRAMQMSGSSSPTGTHNAGASKNSSQIRLSGFLGAHDPNRIPVSIFAARPSNPMEWSIASTESLFSIHVGNNSFSRDHFNFVNKSGELFMSTEFTHPPPNLQPNLPHIVEAAKVESKIEITGNDLSKSQTLTVPQNLIISSPSPADHRIGVSMPVDKFRGRNSTVSCQSDDSINSARSFKFPVLAGDHGATTSSDTTNSKTSKPLKQSPEHQSFEATSASPTSRIGCFTCFSWCSHR